MHNPSSVILSEAKDLDLAGVSVNVRSFASLRMTCRETSGGTVP